MAARPGGPKCAPPLASGMHTTRRGYLAGAAGAVAGLAGCLGGGGGGGGNCDAAVSGTVDSMPSPTIGDPDAAVTVKVFEDFSCPHCANFSLNVFPRLREEYVSPGDVAYEHHDLPIPVSQEWSWAVASAARSVQDQTDAEAFFAFAKACYENQGSYSMSLLSDLGSDAGAEGCAVRAAANQETYRPVVEADRQRGIDMGAEGTPAVFVNGNQVTPSYDAISAAIDSA